MHGTFGSYKYRNILASLLSLHFSPSIHLYEVITYFSLDSLWLWPPLGDMSERLIWPQPLATAKQFIAETKCHLRLERLPNGQLIEVTLGCRVALIPEAKINEAFVASIVEQLIAHEEFRQ